MHSDMEHAYKSIIKNFHKFITESVYIISFMVKVVKFKAEVRYKNGWVKMFHASKFRFRISMGWIVKVEVYKIRK